MSKNWKIIREADDPLALRLSIGSPNGNGFTIENDGYIVYRGDTQECIQLLETALAQLKSHYKEQGE